MINFLYDHGLQNHSLKFASADLGSIGNKKEDTFPDTLEGFGYKFNKGL